MTRFEKFIPIIFKNEGILSDNVNDKGGLTKYGISQKAYPNLDIKNLTKKQAEAIYKKDYYDKCRIDDIKEELLALHVFDMAVNAGNSRAIKMLQRLLVISADGVIGNDTITHANSALFGAAFIQARNVYYKQIATGRNTVFLKGWLNRVINTTNYIK
jgi:lysozyme family protein